MSEATQLLNNLDEINSRLADPSGEGHIIIGDDRFITVPDELKRIAVQYDHNIETVTFDCPRFWDDHDMSKMNVYINYLRSDRAPGVYKADNIRVDETDESIMHFDWTISKNVTTTAGNIVFLVCVKKADDEGNEENHWNSELCKDCYVSEGLEIDGGVSETIRPDVIEQWYRELMALAYSGEFDGEPGVGIASIEQTSVSTEDGGENIVTMTLTDGQTADVVIHNGSKGVTALPIVTCYTSDGVLYSNNTGLYNYNKTFFVEGRQFVFIPAANTGATAEANTTDTPMVSLGLKDRYFIKLRSANDQSTTVPIGMLKHGVPYTMTFSGEYWLVDSYVEGSQVENTEDSSIVDVTENYRDSGYADPSEYLLTLGEGKWKIDDNWIIYRMDIINVNGTIWAEERTWSDDSSHTHRILVDGVVVYNLETEGAGSYGVFEIPGVALNTGSSNIYIQEGEPADAPDGSLLIDESVEGSSGTTSAIDITVFVETLMDSLPDTVATGGPDYYWLAIKILEALDPGSYESHSGVGRYEIYWDDTTMVGGIRMKFGTGSVDIMYAEDKSTATGVVAIQTGSGELVSNFSGDSSTMQVLDYTLTGLAEPTEDSGAANKKYVDDAIAAAFNAIAIAEEGAY